MTKNIASVRFINHIFSLFLKIIIVNVCHKQLIKKDSFWLHGKVNKILRYLSFESKD